MKVYCRILGPVYDNEKEYLRILTNKEIYAMAKNSTITEIIRLKRLRWFVHVQRMEKKQNYQKSIMYEFGNNKAER